jgi:NAD-dependent dihydropyrimidine dehydrogenase PreA subunit
MSNPLARLPESVDNQTPRVGARQRTPTRGEEFPSTYIITEPCIDTKDASCVEVCPVDCIYEGDDQFYIHPDECIDCGACEPECPVQAIFPDTDVPQEWTNYIEKNRAHFD